MRAPLGSAYITQVFKDTHRANDLGWISNRIVDPPVFAYDDGVVIESTFTVLGGNVIAIRHEGNDESYWISRYVHLKSRAVTVGTRVLAKQQIGIGGSTGNSTGPHLHFEVWVCPKAFVYKGVTNTARNAYAKNPLNLIFLMGETIKGGYNMLTIDIKQMVTAKTAVNVRLRDKATTESISLGLAPLNTPIPVIGVTNVIGGYQWLILWYNNRVCYSAAEYWTVTTPVNTVEVIKEVIKEVDRPHNVQVIQDGLSITITDAPK